MEKILDFIKPVTDYIDSGKLFRQPIQLLYRIIGVLCALFPFYIFYEMIEYRVFKYIDDKEIIAIVLILLVLLAVCLVCFALWFQRASKLTEILKPGSKFVAAPVIANFVQTGGEFAGIFIGMFGFFSSLIMLIFDTFIELPFGGANSIVTAISMAITGYLIIIVSRWFAELILSIADIANNTDKIANR